MKRTWTNEYRMIEGLPYTVSVSHPFPQTHIMWHGLNLKPNVVASRHHEIWQKVVDTHRQGRWHTWQLSHRQSLSPCVPGHSCCYPRRCLWTYQVCRSHTHWHLEIQPNRAYRLVAIVGFTMTSANGNIFCVTGPLCGEFTSHQWFPLTKASDAELWCFLWSAHEWMLE